MLFNSLQFVFFFAFVFFAYYTLPHRFRWVLLLAASCYFYMAFVPKYILILGFLIVADFFLARYMERSNGRSRTFYLVISIVCNIGLLGFFKYFNFFNENVAHIAQFLHWNYSAQALSIILPLGLSFHVFQSLSYVIEVYKGRYTAETHLGMYSLYVMFFPQLVAGPIERPQHLLPQLKDERRFDRSKVLEGFTLMLVGFFKKLVIADGLALYVDRVFTDPGLSNGASIVAGAAAFAFQLYCDFSGYSDIAIGSACALGIDLAPNFDRPYASRSIAEFWRRWHISLSSWLRDYLYFPLAFSLKRWGKAGPLLALFVSFVLIGLWHGAGWTYVAFGALNGFYLVFGSLTKPWRERFVVLSRLDRFPSLLGAARVMCVFLLSCAGWIFFRASTLRDALAAFANLFAGWGTVFDIGNLNAWMRSALSFGSAKMAVIIVSIIAMEILQYFQTRGALYQQLQSRPRVLRWGLYYALVLWILVFGYFSERYFLYFQF